MVVGNEILRCVDVVDDLGDEVGAAGLLLGEYPLVLILLRDVPLRYEIVEYDAPQRVVLEARRPGFTSRDTITVEPTERGSNVHYDAILAFSGLGRLFDPVMQRIFNRVGAQATTGMKAALNP